MATLLERAARRLKDGLDVTSGVCVEYRRDAYVLQQLKAIPGQSTFEQLSISGDNATAKTFDWIVSASDLFLEGQKTEPAKGDFVLYQLSDGRVAHYIVVAEAGERCFDVVDQLGILLRIHSKLDHIDQAQ